MWSISGAEPVAMLGLAQCYLALPLAITIFWRSRCINTIYFMSNTVVRESGMRDSVLDHTQLQLCTHTANVEGSDSVLADSCTMNMTCDAYYSQNYMPVGC